MNASVREIGLELMQELQVKDAIVAGVQITIVSYEQFADFEFEPPATFFTRSAMGQYYFYHTRHRAKAQAACDELFGKSHYTVTATKIQRGRKGLTCTGTHTRRGQRA